MAITVVPSQARYGHNIGDAVPPGITLSSPPGLWPTVWAGTSPSPAYPQNPQPLWMPLPSTGIDDVWSSSVRRWVRTVWYN